MCTGLEPLFDVDFILARSQLTDQPGAQLVVYLSVFRLQLLLELQYIPAILAQDRHIFDVLTGVLGGRTIPAIRASSVKVSLPS